MTEISIFFFSLELVGLSCIPSLNLFFEILNEIDLQMIVFFFGRMFRIEYTRLSNNVEIFLILILIIKSILAIHNSLIFSGWNDISFERKIRILNVTGIIK